MKNLAFIIYFLCLSLLPNLIISGFVLSPLWFIGLPPISAFMLLVGFRVIPLTTHSDWSDLVVVVVGAMVLFFSTLMIGLVLGSLISIWYYLELTISLAMIVGFLFIRKGIKIF